MEKKERGIFRDIFAIFKNKNIKLATSRPSHFLGHTTWISTFVKMLQPEIETWRFTPK
jgi:hypothetical protein